MRFNDIDIMVKEKGEKEKTTVLKLYDQDTGKEYKIHIWIWSCCFIAKDDDNEKYSYPGFKVKARCYNKEYKFKIVKKSTISEDVLNFGIDPIILNTPFSNFIIEPYSRIIEMDNGEEIIDEADGYFSIKSHI